MDTLLGRCGGRKPLLRQKKIDPIPFRHNPDDQESSTVLGNQNKYVINAPEQ